MGKSTVQEEGSAVAAGDGPRTDHVGYARLLAQVDLFAGLERVTLAKLAAHLEPISYKRHAVIFRQSEPGDAFYLVASGTVGVYTAGKDRSGELCVRVLGAGEPFGEMALLTNSPRTASIRAESDCEVLRLDRGAFIDLVRQQPSVALSIAATLSRRLAGMLDRSGGAVFASKAPAPAHAAAAAAGMAAAVAASQRPKWRPGRSGVAAIAAVVILAAGWWIAPPLGLSAQAWHALVILLAALPALALDALLEGVLALLMAAAWVLFGVAAPEVALAGFASESWVLVVAVLIVGAAITASGVLYRLALETITHMRGGFPGEVSALAVAGLLMGPAVPNATSRVVIIAPMLSELVEALGYRPHSRAAAGLAMAVLIGFGQMAAVFLTSSTTAVLIAALLPPGERQVNWITWALYGAPINLIVFAGLLGAILWLYRPEPGERKPSGSRATSLALQRALLGPMSRNEKVSLGVGLGLLAGFIAQPLHGVHPAWVAVTATAVLAAARVANADTLRAVNWNVALLFGVLISLAAVFSNTGLDRWMANGIASMAGDIAATPVLFLAGVTLLCFAVSFVVRWQAAAPLITIALAPVAEAAGIHPFIVGLIAVIACNGFFLPYQSTTYLALSAGTGGKLFTHAQARPAALAYAVCTLIAVVLSVPVWRAMGLL